MIAYKKDGKLFILVANSARGVMKLDASNISTLPAITTQTLTTAGMPITLDADLKNVTHLAKVDGDIDAVIVVVDASSSSLKTIALP